MIKKEQKKNRKVTKNLSQLIAKNTMLILSVLILIFAFIVTVSILAFETGMLITQGHNPHSYLWIYLLFTLTIFAIVFFVVYFQNKKIAN